MTATASRRRSGHGLTSSGSSTQLARRGSSSRLSNTRGRFDPSLMMSSNAAPGNAGRDRSPHDDSNGAEHDASHDDKARRRNKSTDRVQRSHSSSHLSSKRSKSYTNLGMTAGDPNGGGRLKTAKSKGKGQRQEREEEGGWTSASADNTPSDHSGQGSPSSSPGDEGLVMGIKKRPVANLKLTNSNLPDSRKEPFPQPPDTPRASAPLLQPEDGRAATNRKQAGFQPGTTSAAADADEISAFEIPDTQAQPTAAQLAPNSPAQVPAQLRREDTSKTLVNQRRDDTEETETTASSRTQQRQASHSASTSEGQPKGSGGQQQGDADQQDGAPHATPGVAALHRSLSGLKLVDSPASEIPPPRTGSTLSLNPDGATRHHRVSSSASNRTLRSSMPMPASPSSVRSRSSVMSSRFLLPREPQAAAPPMLDTHNALAGRLGARHEDRGDMLAPLAGPSRSGRSVSAMTSSTSAPVGLDQQQHGSLDSRYNSVGRAGTSKGAHSTLAAPSPSSSAAHAGSATLGHGSQQRSAKDSTAAERRRTTSTQSLTAADAAKLAAKLRLARDSMDDHALGGYGSNQRGAQGYNPRLEKYKKPVVSTFVKDAATDVPQAVEVQANSVYSKLFAQAHDSQEGRESHRRMIRYVMGYGISGPPFEKSRLSDALLGPSLDMADFESSWAPALAHAAGLGAAVQPPIQTEYGLVTPDAPAAAGGPNSTPLHLLHGLTTTSPDPFPLDPTDVPALQEDPDVFDSHAVSSQLGQNPIQLVDPGLIRAIAITTHAIATHRSHVVTRRYADPMREGLERVVRSSGRYVPHTGKTGSSVPNSPQVSSRWGRKTAPNSPVGSRIDVRDGGYRPGFQRRNTSDQQPYGGHQGLGHHSNSASSTLYNLVDAAEHPVRSLKRVWSGGIARGGLAALTRTDEE